jgi:hypothetical protein
MGRQGWKKDPFNAGDRIVLDVWLAKTTGLHKASMPILTLPDGRVISGKSGWDNPIRRQ